jgi:hypothetical protein
LYIILSALGWAWCLAVGVFLWVRLRRRPGTPREQDKDVARVALDEGREEVRA